MRPLYSNSSTSNIMFRVFCRALRKENHWGKHKLPIRHAALFSTSTPTFIGNAGNTAAAAVVQQQQQHALIFSIDTLCSMTDIQSNSEISNRLLSCIHDRLGLQLQTLDCMREMVARNDNGQQRTLLKSLDMISYIHVDTQRLAKRLLQIGDNIINSPGGKTPSLWDRWSTPDQHTINATFLELRARHSNTIEHVVTNIGAFNGSDAPKFHRLNEIFLRRRAGIQLLCDHHIKLFKTNTKVAAINIEKTGVAKNEASTEVHQQQFGCIQKNVQVRDIINDAVQEAQHIVDAHLQIYPDTEYTENPSAIAFPAISVPWIHHAVVEVLKNGMSSAIYYSRSSDSNNLDTPKVRINARYVTVDKVKNTSSSSINEASSDNTTHNDSTVEDKYIELQIIDNGTGIAVPEGDDADECYAAALYGIGHSSSTTKWDRIDEQQSYAAVRSPLSSLGVGLPISLYMMEHFGGSMDIRNNAPSSDEKNGCTVTIRIPLNTHVMERNSNT